MAKKKAENIKRVENTVLSEVDREIEPVQVEKTTDLEREPGEEFDYDETRLRVLEILTYGCKGCFFWCNACVSRNKSITGQCIGRKDGKSVIFKQVKK